MANDLNTIIRNLRKNRDMDVEATSNHYMVKYKGDKVCTISSTPKDRNATKAVLGEIARRTGLTFDSKGRVTGTRVRVLSGKGHGAPVTVIPAEMGSELDGEELTVPKRHHLTLPPPAVPTRVAEDEELSLGGARPYVEREEDMEWGRCPTPAPAVVPEPEPEPQPEPQEEPTVSTEMTEETTVPPRRRREYKKRPPMDQAAIEGRRDFVVAYLDDHAGQSFSAMHLQEVLQQAGEDITVSGVRMMMWVLVNEERVQALHEGNLVRFSSKLSTPPVREPEPEQQQQSLEEGMAELAKDATAALARVTPQPREEVKMTTPQTNGSHADADNQRIAELERENRILRNMVMRARGLTPEQFEMALDLAREMADQ